MTSEPKTGNKVAEKIAGGILKMQTAFANRMTKTVIVCFCIISGALSIYFLVDAIVSKPKAKIRVDHIRTIKPIDEPSEDLYDNKIPDEIYQQIQDYKRYADSIGEPIRPGLADSMRILEEMYLQQQK